MWRGQQKRCGRCLGTLRVASPGGGGTLHVEFDDEDKTVPVTDPGMYHWQQWWTVTTRPLRLPAGRQVMRVVFDTGGSEFLAEAGGRASNLNRVAVRKAAPGGNGRPAD